METEGPSLQKHHAGYFRFAFVTLLISLPLSAYGESPTAFAFVSGPQTVAVGAASEQITVQSQDGSGNKVNLPSTACAVLSSSSSGEFSSSASAWSAVSVLTLSKNSANRNFYYKGSIAGTHTLTVVIVLKPEGEGRSCANWPIAEWPTSSWSASQAITVGSAASGEALPSSESTASSVEAGSGSTSSAPPSSASSSSGGPAAPIEPRIFVYPSVPPKAVAGADVFFEAKVLGIKKEPIANARLIWSFGDGGTAEGPKVLHAYHYPASYAVLVEASSGEWSATARKDIIVTPPALSISTVREGADGFIEVYNGGQDDVDLSRWHLQSAGAFFSFPKGTILPAGKKIPFPGAITKLSPNAANTAILYPNGTVVVRYEPPDSLPPKPSFVPQAEISKSEAKPTPAPIVVQEEPEAEEVSSTTPLLAASAGGTTNSFPYLAAVTALIMVAIGGYVWRLRFPHIATPEEELRKEAEQYEIIEEKST